MLINLRAQRNRLTLGGFAHHMDVYLHVAPLIIQDIQRVTNPAGTRGIVCIQKQTANSQKCLQFIKYLNKLSVKANEHSKEPVCTVKAMKYHVHLFHKTIYARKRELKTTR